MTKIIDIKSLLIGFLLATSVMLFIGATNDNGNGRYQVTSGGQYGNIVLLDTQNAELYNLTLTQIGNTYRTQIALLKDQERLLESNITEILEALTVALSLKYIKFISFIIN